MADTSSLALQSDITLVLQPLWDQLLELEQWRGIGLVSNALFPGVVATVAYIAICTYYTLFYDIPQFMETKIQPSRWPSIGTLLFHTVVQSIGFTLFISLGVYMTPLHIDLPSEAPTLWEAFRDITLAFIVGDSCTYWYHRMFHIPWLYRNIHSVHHQFYEPYSWTSALIHPFEHTCSLMVYYWYPLVMRHHWLTLCIFAFIWVAWLLEQHSGHNTWWSPFNLWPFELGGGAPIHDLHHSERSQKNYAPILRLWDRIFGTEIPPNPKFKSGMYDHRSTLNPPETTQILRAIGDPLEELAASGSRFIHVTGTNGKGTVCSGLAERLQRASCRVGLFTSPCQRWPNDQISINGEIMEAIEYEHELERIFEVAKIEGEAGLTYFEATTIAAFSWFSRMKPLDFVVIEVGMGGRDDATNVLPKTDVAVVTGVELDHMNFLGDTKEKICDVKCGIITPQTSTAVVSGAFLSPSCIDIAKQRCALTGSELRVVGVPQDNEDFKAHYRDLERGVLKVLGIEDNVTDSGVENLPVLHGRQELTSCPLNPALPLILDGAHNHQGLASLRHSIQKTLDTNGDITEVRENDRFWSQCVFSYDLSSLFLVKAVDPENAAEAARRCLESLNSTVASADDLWTALQQCASPTDNKSKPLIVVCGSLYLTREYLLLLDEEQLPS
ncbi:Cholesterol 25-hydroxylase-like protein [Perkinsus chesapeaki]|uniref:Cholesterol 25-hydroxylase-like protein n=1 Tax=Perkinsus chesapeaki TaxID=330153 RepID=A0A7J6MC54_PERCH|nr:Cholesterol 25-hydroxylase-like protein [Perkinsus chesapeaki]